MITSIYDVRATEEIARFLIVSFHDCFSISNTLFDAT